MSEPVRQSDSIPSQEARTSEQDFSLPTILRGAAYISSGGRIYRLFSEGDEASLQLASFGELFRFDPLPELQPLEELEELASLPIEIKPVTALEKVEPFPELQPLENLSLPTEIQAKSSVDFLSATPSKKAENSFKTMFAKNESVNNETVTKMIQSDHKASPVLSVRRPPAVIESVEPEPILKKDLVSTVTTISTTTKNVQKISNTTASVPALKTTPSLELDPDWSDISPEPQPRRAVTENRDKISTNVSFFETNPKTVTVSTISEQKSLPQPKSPVIPFPQAPHSIALTKSDDVLVEKSEKNETATIVTKTPVVQLIRLEIRHLHKPKLPFAVRDLPLAQREKQELPESKIESISRQEELIIGQAALPVVLREEIDTETVINDDTKENIVAKSTETERISTETVVTEQVTTEQIVTESVTVESIAVEDVATETHIDESVIDKIIAKNKRSMTEEVNLPVVESSESVEYRKVSKEFIEFAGKNVNETVFTEPVSSAGQLDVTETVSSGDKSNTLIFPQQEPAPSFTALSASSSNSLQESHRTWKLTWEPHWPEHLKSLESEASDQICFLADHLEMLHERGRKVINFNGFRPGDGCTTLALCAARELAERGYRLLLADAHQRNPELPQLLRLKTDPHLYEIITLIQDRLELLPWTETAIEIASPNVLYTQSFTEIVGSFRNDYDFILLDNGSLIEYPLAERVIHWREMSSDGVLLVLNMKDPARINVRDIAQRFRQYHVELLGIAENYV